MRKHGLAGEIGAFAQQRGSARIRPLPGGFRAGLRVGDVLKVGLLMQVGVHELKPWPQDAFTNQGAVERGFAGAVRAR